MNRKYVVVEEVVDKKTNTPSFSQCLGIRDTYEQAIGLAFTSLDERRADSDSSNKEEWIIQMPEPLEGDTGEVISGQYKNDSYYTSMIIYYVDELDNN